MATRKTITLGLACLLTGCSMTPPGMTAEALLGASVVDRGFDGHGPTATFRLRQRISHRTWCEFEHVSYLIADGAEEDALNQVGCGVRIGGE